MVESELITDFRADFEQFIHETFYFRRMLTLADPKVIINMYENEELLECSEMTNKDINIVKNYLLKEYKSIVHNWTNYEVDNYMLEEELKRAIEIYALKEAVSSCYEAIDIGINYLKDHGVECINYDDFEFLKFGHCPEVSQLKNYDLDKKRIGYILASILNRTLKSYDDYIHIGEIMKDNSENLINDKETLKREYHRQGQEVPFDIPKGSKKGTARTRK